MMSQKRFTGAKIVLVGDGGVGKTGNLYIELFLRNNGLIDYAYVFAHVLQTSLVRSGW